MAKVKFLKENELFKDLDDREVALISNGFKEKMYRAGTPLFVEAMPGEAMFIIKKGAVRITKNLDGQNEQELVVLRDGEYFGELSILIRGERLVSARTIEPCELLVLEVDDFDEIMKEDAQTGIKFLKNIIITVGNKLRNNVEILNEFLKWYIQGR